MFGSQKIPVYCHMGDFGCGDGGWTLAMKIDGTKVYFSRTFKLFARLDFMYFLAELFFSVTDIYIYFFFTLLAGQ